MALKRKKENEAIDTFIHLVAGGTGGTVGAIATCPLEVVKTRLQSSSAGYQGPTTTTGAPLSSSSSPSGPTSSSSSKGLKVSMSSFQTFKNLNWRGSPLIYLNHNFHTVSPLSSSLPNSKTPPLPSRNPWHCLKFIVKHEGVRGLFKGLGPNLVGVAPARAIYFWAYSTSKRKLNGMMPKESRESPLVHILSAATAGFTASAMTNPIWLVKTRLQLDRRTGDRSLSVRTSIQNIYRQLGIFGFWKGVTASYWGISETVIHFVIYERLKRTVTNYVSKSDSEHKTFHHFVGIMLCGSFSKTCATSVAYPHEVARTRLREGGTKYRSFWQTLRLVGREEGWRGLYCGLTTQLIRQIPNTAIMMATYELSVYLMTKYLKEGKPLYSSTPSSNSTSSSSTTSGSPTSPDDHHHHHISAHKSSHSQ